MARLNDAAAFVKANMPLGQGNTLTDQEAFDVAAYFTQQPRPDFAAKTQDWPKGGKPPDARYRAHPSAAVVSGAERGPCGWSRPAVQAGVPAGQSS